MIDFLLDFLNTPVGQVVSLAIQIAILVPFVYLIIRCVRFLSAPERWKLVKIVLTILFLPFVLVWRISTAGSDCGCCCDEDD